MISLLVTILIVCIILGLVFWLLGQLPVPPPFKNVILVIAVIIAILVLLQYLPGFHFARG